MKKVVLTVLVATACVFAIADTVVIVGGRVVVLNGSSLGVNSPIPVPQVVPAAAMRIETTILDMVRADWYNEMKETVVDNSGITDTNAEAINMDSELLNKIEDAIKKNNISKITSNDITSIIEPYKVVAFDGFWYLLAKDLKDTKIKTYLIPTDITNSSRIGQNNSLMKSV